MGKGIFFSLIRACSHWHPQSPFQFGNERNKPSRRLGFEMLLKSLRFSLCGPLSAALNKRGFVRSVTEDFQKLVEQTINNWIVGRLGPANK